MAVPRSFLSGINLSGVLQLSSTPGTSGQVLTSQGAGNTPIWTTPGTFGYLGNTQTTASASATISLTVPSISSSTGNAISITAGTTTAANGIGGAVTITGGTVSNLSSITTGGSVNINGGTASSSGSGTGGLVNIDGGIGSGNGNGSVQIGTGTGSDSVTIGKSTGVSTINGSTITLGKVPTLPSQTANTFFAAPNGSAGTPTFRGIQAGDMSTISTPTIYGQAIVYAPAGNGMGWGGPYLATSGGSFSAGTATVAPVKFTSGTNLTAPAAGAKEFDGTVFYGTPAVSTATTGSTVTGRGIIPAIQTFYVNADSVIATATTSTATGNVLNGKSFWLAANTVYEVEYYLHTKLVVGSGGAAASNHNLILTFPTSAVGLVNIDYQTGLTSQTIQSTTIARQSNITTTTNTIDASKAISTTTYYRYVIKGTVKTGATAGYFLVQNGVTTASGTTATITTMAGSYGKSTVLGVAGADINVGPLT